MSPLVWIAGLAPAALAAGLPLLPGGRTSVLALLRGLAIGAALVVVVAALLPEALAAVGPWAFVAFGVGVLLPVVLERVVGPVAMWGLAFHQLLDGMQVGILGAALGPAGALAMAAHGGPLVAAATLGEDRATGIRRGLLLLLATGIGMAAGALVPASVVEPIEPWAEAVVAGLLLHLLGHDLLTVMPRTVSERIGDAVGFATGLVATAAVIGDAAVLGEIPRIAADAAPAVGIGLLVGAATEAIGWPAGPRSRGLAALHGALAAHAAAPGTTPQGSGASGLAAALCARAVGAETIFLSVVFLGWQLALLRWVVVVALAVLAAFALADGPGKLKPASAGFLEALDRRVVRLVPWLVVGIVLAAGADTLLEPAALRALADQGLDVPLVAVIAGPARIGALALPPIASELWSSGLPARAVLVGLLLAPTVSLASIREAYEHFGRRGVCAVLLVAVGSVLVALPIEAPAPRAWGPPPELALPAALAVAALAAWSAWRAGSRGWVATWLGEAHG